MAIKLTYILALFALQTSCVLVHDGDKTPPPPDAPAPPAGCEGKHVLELAQGALWQTALNGTQRKLLQFGEASGVAADRVFPLQWERAGAYHAMLASLRTGSASHEYELVLFDQAGTIVLTQRIAERNHPRLGLSHDGRVAVRMPNGGSFIAQAGKPNIALGAYTPLMAPVGDHVLVADKPIYWNAGARFGWLNLTSQQVAFFEAQDAPSYGDFTPLGDRALFWSQASQRLIIAAPGVTQPVAFAADRPVQELAVAAISPNMRFVLLHDYGQALYRVDTHAQLPTAITVAAIPSEGVENWAGPRFTIADDGAIFATQTTATNLQAIKSSDLGHTWRPIGEAVPRSHNGFEPILAIMARGDSAFVLAFDVGYGFFLRGVQAVDDNNFTVAHDSGGIYDQVSYDYDGSGLADLAADGGCAVSWRLATDADPLDGNFDGGPVEMVAIDYASGLTQVVRQASRITQLRFQ